MLCVERKNRLKEIKSEKRKREKCSFKCSYYQIGCAFTLLYSYTYIHAYING